jgi:hypothetical protein
VSELLDFAERQTPMHHFGAKRPISGQSQVCLPHGAGFVPNSHFADAASPPFFPWRSVVCDFLNTAIAK